MESERSADMFIGLRDKGTEMRRKGFTLVEIMIVILIMGLLLSIALPQWARARERSQSKSCIATMRQIRDAKDQYAMEMRLSNGAPCAVGDIWPSYIRQSSPPTCPSGGVITIGIIGTDPTCTIVGLYPHVLP